jgi:hypothetical protein
MDDPLLGGVEGVEERRGASGSSLSNYSFIPQAAGIAARQPQTLGWQATGQTSMSSGGAGTAIKEMGARHGVIASCGVDGGFFGPDF